MKIKRNSPISNVIFWIAFGLWLREGEKIPTEIHDWGLLWRIPLGCGFVTTLAALWLGIYGFLLAVNYAASDLRAPTIIVIAILYDIFFLSAMFFGLRRRRT